MKRYLILLVLLLVVGCTAKDLTPPEQISDLLKDGAILVDVRTKSEFDSGHLKGALHLPHGEILQLPKRTELTKEQTIVVYCRSGRRSGFAKDSLTKAGYKAVYNGGGYSTLKEAGIEADS